MRFDRRWRFSGAARQGLAALCVALAAGLTALPDGHADEPALSFVALGDQPYSLREQRSWPDLIEAINRAEPTFVVHVGDIKRGSAPCTGGWLLAVRALLSRIEAPVVYTPGDNEWTDCRRPEAGGFDPEERLAALRQVFFSGFFAGDDERLGVERQSDDPSHRDYVENARWSIEGVVFATLHVVGSNNNDREGDARAQNEFARRSAANRAWLAATLQRAEAEDARALVLFFHGDPFVRSRNGASGYREFLGALARAARAFKGPVLLVHGDSHEYWVDQPLIDPADGAALSNVTRVEVFGSPTVEAVEVRVRWADAQPFAIRPLGFAMQRLGRAKATGF